MTTRPAAVDAQLAMTEDAPSVAVVICGWASDRWPDMRRALRSALAQTRPAAQVVFVSDNNGELLSRCRAEFADVTAVLNNGARGASAARNAGVAATETDAVAFLDDDAIAAPDWLEKLVRHHGESGVVGVGGYCAPGWDRPSGAPRWFPDEFAWTVGASYTGMPTEVAQVRNVWSCSLLVRRDTFDAIGGFVEEFAKVGKRSRPEDTDFCIRAARHSGGHWLYEPEAVIEHRVPSERSTFRYFLVRCFREGEGKAEMSAMLGRQAAVRAETQFVRNALLRVVPRHLLAAVRGDVAGVARAGAIVSGIAAAAAGHLQGRARAATRRSSAR